MRKSSKKQVPFRTLRRQKPRERRERLTLPGEESFRVVRNVGGGRSDASYLEYSTDRASRKIKCDKK